MDRYDFFYKQVVTEGDLDQAFDAAEEAIKRIMADAGLLGIFQGFSIAPTVPATFNVEIGGPSSAYDAEGRRVHKAGDQIVDCTEDEDGNPTSVVAGKERWLSIFAEYTEDLSDPRYDGNDVLIYFVRSEGINFYVTMGSEANIGAATKPSKAATVQHPAPILIGDVRIYDGQGAIDTPDIDLSRRDSFFSFAGDQVSIDEGSLSEIFDQIMTAFDNHLDGDSYRHTDDQIDTDPYAPPGGEFELTAATLELQLQEIADFLDGLDADHDELRSEVEAARGSMPSLDARLDVALEEDGTLNVPHTYLSDMPSAVNDDHDGRYFTETELDPEAADGANVLDDRFWSPGDDAHWKEWTAIVAGGKSSDYGNAVPFGQSTLGFINAISATQITVFGGYYHDINDGYKIKEATGGPYTASYNGHPDANLMLVYNPAIDDIEITVHATTATKVHLWNIKTDSSGKIKYLQPASGLVGGMLNWNFTCRPEYYSPDYPYDSFQASYPLQLFFDGYADATKGTACTLGSTDVSVADTSIFDDGQLVHVTGYQGSNYHEFYDRIATVFSGTILRLEHVSPVTMDANEFMVSSVTELYSMTEFWKSSITDDDVNRGWGAALIIPAYDACFQNRVAFGIATARHTTALTDPYGFTSTAAAKKDGMNWSNLFTPTQREFRNDFGNASLQYPEALIFYQYLSTESPGTWINGMGENETGSISGIWIPCDDIDSGIGVRINVGPHGALIVSAAVDKQSGDSAPTLSDLMRVSCSGWMSCSAMIEGGEY